jgi:hypothetical protein
MKNYINIIIISGSTVLVRTLAASHRRFRNPIKTLGRTPLDEWSACRKGLYLHRTTLNRNTKKNNHARSGIRTHDPRNQAAKTYALERAATGMINEELYAHHKLYIYIYLTSELSTTQNTNWSCVQQTLPAMCLQYNWLDWDTWLYYIPAMNFVQKWLQIYYGIWHIDLILVFAWYRFKFCSAILCFTEGFIGLSTRNYSVIIANSKCNPAWLTELYEQTTTLLAVLGKQPCYAKAFLLVNITLQCSTS